MTDEDRPETIRELDSLRLAPAPVQDLLTAGHSLKRRRRAVLASVAAAVVLVTGVSVATAGSSPTRNTNVDIADQSDAYETQPFPDPPEGSKWVGVNGVVVAVPTEWPVTDAPCGSTAVEGVVTVPRTSDVPDCGPPSEAPVRVEFVRISRDAPGDAGSSVVSQCLETNPMQCSKSVDFPDQRVGVRLVTIGATGAGNILSTAMVLPDGWTTVPVGGEARASTRARLLKDAGFVVDFSALGYADIPNRSEPESGSPVREGATITLVSNEQAQDPETQELAVEVEDVRPNDDLARQDLNSAVWNADRQTLFYRSEWPNGACVGTGEASNAGTSVQVVLTLQLDGFCVTHSMGVTISGLTEAPTELTVTEDGETRTVPVEQEQSPETQKLTVTVERVVPGGDETPASGSAFWDSAKRTVTYLSPTGYNGCWPVGTASGVGSSVSLALALPSGSACGDIRVWIAATVGGLTEAPAELIVTEDGETRTVPVE